jgi:hypothetical protein
VGGRGAVGAENVRELAEVVPKEVAVLEINRREVEELEACRHEGRELVKLVEPNGRGR